MENITRKIVFTLLAIIVIVGVVVGINYWQKHKDDDKTNSATAVLSISALNQTKNQSATSVTANPNDIVVFTLIAENQTGEVIPGYVMQVNVGEVTNVSTLIDAQGASYDSSNNSLVWTPLDIPANGNIQKNFSVRVNSIDTNKGVMMKITFNNELEIFIASKPVTSGTTNNSHTSTANNGYKAPVSGPVENYSLWLAIISTAAFFGYRRYKLSKV